MSKRSESFVEKCLRGQARIDEIDDFVEKWHVSAKDIDIEVFLGLTKDEYKLWLKDPNALGSIIASRREGATAK